MSNAVTKQYSAEVAEERSELRQAARRLVLPEVFAQSYGELQLDRPLFVPEQEIEAFADDLAAVFDLLVSLPQRLFGGDLRAYCAALGMDERLAELMCRGATGKPPLYARADAYHDGTSFKLLELNVGSELGGTDTAQLNRAFLAVPAFAEFAERNHLGHIDTVARVVAALRKAAAVTADEPVIALIESTGGIAAHEHVFVALQEAFRAHGVDLVLGEIHELTEQADGKIAVRGTPLDVVLRYFVAGELVDDPAGQRVLDTLIRADEAGRTVLFTPLEGAIFASKGSLGMLHDPRVRETFTADERAVVDRVVPWTRLLSATGDTELFERCRAERENLVLKPGVGYGGVGTVVGHEVTDEQWQDALRARTTGDHVVQQRVRPAFEPVCNADDGEVEDWVANWGIFVDADGYAGGFVRALKPGDGAVVSYSNKGTRGTCVFTTP